MSSKHYASPEELDVCCRDWHYQAGLDQESEERSNGNVDGLSGDVGEIQIVAIVSVFRCSTGK